MLFRRTSSSKGDDFPSAPLHFIEWYDDMNDELERMWKKAVVDYFMELYKQICLVFGYWLDDRVIEVRSAAEAKGIFL
jgi:hypothetical protein